MPESMKLTGQFLARRSRPCQIPAAGPANTALHEKEAADPTNNCSVR